MRSKKQKFFHFFLVIMMLVFGVCFHFAKADSLLSNMPAQGKNPDTITSSFQQKLTLKTTSLLTMFYEETENLFIKTISKPKSNVGNDLFPSVFSAVVFPVLFYDTFLKLIFRIVFPFFVIIIIYIHKMDGKKREHIWL